MNYESFKCLSTESSSPRIVEAIHWLHQPQLQLLHLVPQAPASASGSEETSVWGTVWGKPQKWARWKLVVFMGVTCSYIYIICITYNLQSLL